MGMGRYVDVQVSAFAEGDGVRVEIELVPVRDVRRLVFTGDLGLPEGTLRAAVEERFGMSPPPGRAADIARAVEELLANQGYLRPSVAVRAQDPVAADGAMVFHVTCGARAVVGTVSYRADDPADVRDIQSSVPLKPGEFFNRAELRRRLDAVADRWRARRYYEARAEFDDEESANGESVDVIITFVRGPLVTVSVKDNALTPKQLAEFVPAEREGSLDEDLLEDSDARIEESLRAQGYKDARASHEPLVRGDQLEIVFTVKYGPLYRVADVRFEGADSIAAAELAALMQMGKGQAFVQARLDADARALLALYRQRGFGDASCRPAIEPVPGARTAKEAPVVIVMRIAEGPRTIVTAVDIAGATVVPAAELKSGLATRQGGPLFEPDLEADRDRILLEYFNLGYRLARVAPSISVSADRTGAKVGFVIEEGPRVYVDHILVVGNRRIAETTIRRELLLKPGEPMGLDAIEQSQRRLAALVVFRRVTISELQHESDDRRDVLVSVEESPATTLGYGGGVEFQKVENIEVAPRGFFEVGRRNLWGKNRSINLFSRVSVRRRTDTVPETPASPATEVSRTTLEYRVIGAYREPRFAGTAADLQASLGFEQGSRTSFSFRSQSARVNLTQRYGPRWNLQGQYSIERNDIFDDRINPIDRPLIYRLFPDVRIGSISVSGVRNTRDDVFNPTRGALVGLNGELALRPIGSEVGFAKTFLQGFFYRQLPSSPRIVLAAGARLGLGAGFPRDVPLVIDGEPILGPDGTQLTTEVRDLPWSERYFAGGDTTVRGFQLDRLGETETFDRDGTPIGGRAEIILNGEIRVALWKDLGVVGFIDTGNVYWTVSNLSLGDLRAGAGFGLRYNSPVGPFRFDFGFKLGTLRTYGLVQEDRFALHISIGQAF
jgi:outer membrane protein assembly complex protein YaeT